MPFICKDKFEKHKKGLKHDDDLHVEAISNPELAAKIAALKYVKNSHLDEKLTLLDTEKDRDREYLKNIINQKNKNRLMAMHQHSSSYQAYIGH